MYTYRGLTYGVKEPFAPFRLRVFFEQWTSRRFSQATSCHKLWAIPQVLCKVLKQKKSALRRERIWTVLRDVGCVWSVIRWGGWLRKWCR